MSAVPARFFSRNDEPDEVPTLYRAFSFWLRPKIVNARMRRIVAIGLEQEFSGRFLASDKTQASTLAAT